MSIEDSLSYSFLNMSRGYVPFSRIQSINYNNYNTSLLIDCSSNNLEVPILLVDYLVPTLNIEIPSCIYHIPLYSCSPSTTLRTATKIFEDVLNLTYMHRIRKVSTPNATYYIGKGLILNSEFKPLLMLSLKVNRTGEIKDAVCRIHPRVFESPKDLINKTIIKKVMPFYMFKEVSVIDSIILEGSSYKKAEIIISDFDNMFVTPNEPNLSTLDNDVHQCLLDNIRDIVCQ